MGMNFILLSTDLVRPYLHSSAEIRHTSLPKISLLEKRPTLFFCYLPKEVESGDSIHIFALRYCYLDAAFPLILGMHCAIDTQTSHELFRPSESTSIERSMQKASRSSFISVSFPPINITAHHYCMFFIFCEVPRLHSSKRAVKLTKKKRGAPPTFEETLIPSRA